MKKLILIILPALFFLSFNSTLTDDTGAYDINRVSINGAGSRNGRLGNGFFLGPINGYFVESLHSPEAFSLYSLLSYNLMHNYSSHPDSLGFDWTTQREGGFLEPLSSYYDFINKTITLWYNYASENSLIYQREKVERGGYGQRSTYQAEGDENYWNARFPRYGFRNSNTTGREKTDDAVYGSNVIVKYCKVNEDAPGRMVGGLIENAEQVNFYSPVPPEANRNGHRLFSDIKQPQYNFKWNIKPRIRIDSVYAKEHPLDPAAIIETKNFSGNIIKTDTIFCNNFLRYYGGAKFYDGGYIEMFYNLNGSGNTPVPYYVKADSLIQGRTASNDWRDSRVDFSVTWCGKVDMYIDYVRIDDDWAHYLFTDSEGKHPYYKFHQKIQEEVNAFGGTPGFGYFYIDEIFFNNIPCVAEVNRIIKSVNPNTSMLIMSNVDRMFTEGGLKGSLNDAVRDAVLDELFSSGAEQDIYLDFSYPYYYKFYFPPNVASPDKNQVPASVVFNKATTPAQYNENNEWGIQRTIQESLNLNKKARMKAKEHNMDFAYSVQLHSDEASIDPKNPNSWGLREPTNEEISVLCYTGLALGAKQLLQYSFHSQLQQNNFNSWGLAYINASTNWVQKKREQNYYGQPKWNFIQTLNQKLRAIGNVLYPANENSKHLIYEKTISVNKGEIGYDYISDIKSKIINTEGQSQYSSDPKYGYTDNNSVRYWEIGFFNPNSQNPTDKNKYFLAVNKRCAPTAGGYSDERGLYIKFDKNRLQSFTDWKIVNAVTNEIIAALNTNSGEYVYLGIFQPGEGKLLKLVPVI